MTGPGRIICALLRPGWRGFAAASALQFASVASGTGLLATSAWLIATAALHPSIAALGVAIVGVRFFGLARGILRYLERLAAHGSTLSLLARLRVAAYSALVPLSPAGLARERSGDLVSRLVDDVNDLDTLYVRVIGPSAAAGLTAILACVILVPRGGALAAATVAGLVIAGAVIPVVAMRAGSRSSARAVAARGDLAARAVDAVQGVGDLLAFDRSDAFRADLARRGRQLVAEQTRTVRISAAGSAAAALAGDLTALAVLGLAVPLVRSGALDGVQLPVVVLTALAAFEVASPLAAAWPSLGATRAAAGRLAALTDAGPMVSEPAAPLAPPDGRELEVRRLSFRYPGTGRDVLRDVSFALRPGQCIAVVGTSGAGKSTIASLLLRFYEAPAGSILLDGRDVRDYATNAVRACLSYADQRASILTGTLRGNLRIAREDADDEAMIEALRAVGLDERIQNLPQGLDSWIGEQGQHLSGGERQRLALARAILRPSPFLILDEPGAHLDPLAEQQVLLTVRQLARDRGVILITHRAIDLGFAKEIIVLREGRVVERGTFESLRQAGGWFRRMLDLQRAEAVIETGSGPSLAPVSGSGGN